MSIFNGKRLTNETFKLDIERMRKGWYSDKYFGNVEHLLGVLQDEGFSFKGQPVQELFLDIPEFKIGELEVEMQIFTRREPAAIVVGADKALTMLRHCTGYFDNQHFVETWQHLEVDAVQDGVKVTYDGNPRQVKPVIRVRGRYRDFANLETPMLGILSRSTRIATNVYGVLKAARGKPILFFPARFDMHEVQAADGYAYEQAVQRFNRDYGQHLRAFVSTDAQGDWWGSTGGGTVPHAIIACFLGDTVAAMRAFARTQPLNVPRIALVDFNNDCAGTSAAVATNFWQEYLAAVKAGDETRMKQWKLYGVRLDTSSSMRDVGLTPLGTTELDLGVNPRLVMLVRQTLDGLWESWDVPEKWQTEAQAFCREIKIVVSGGFDLHKIQLFEKLGVPVDIYGVGSSLMRNEEQTNTDFTADVVRIKLDGNWVDMAKLGRQPCDNADMEKVDLSGL